jgi:hypothetical protein
LQVLFFLWCGQICKPALGGSRAGPRASHSAAGRGWWADLAAAALLAEALLPLVQAPSFALASVRLTHHLLRQPSRVSKRATPVAVRAYNRVACVGRGHVCCGAPPSVIKGP